MDCVKDLMDCVKAGLDFSFVICYSEKNKRE